MIIPYNDLRWSRLRILIETLSLTRGNFTLTSGATTDYIFQLRQVALHPEGGSIIGDIIAEYMERTSIQSVGGLAVGAVPLIAAASVMSFVKNTPKNAFFVRKEAKPHGALERINGHLTDGEVLIIDDAATSGGSILQAIDGLLLEFPNCFVKKALVIVDREEGATENLLQRGVELVSMFTKSDFNI